MLREFEPPVSDALRIRLIELVTMILDRAPKVKSLFGRDFAMDDEDAYVGRRVSVDLGEETGSIGLAQSEPTAEP